MSIPFQFDDPLVINGTTGETTTEAAILSINDEPNLQRLQAMVQLKTYPGIYETITLAELDEYDALGDWTYADLIAMIQDFFVNRWKAPMPPAPTEEPAPEGE